MSFPVKKQIIRSVLKKSAETGDRVTVLTSAGVITGIAVSTSSPYLEKVRALYSSTADVHDLDGFFLLEDVSMPSKANNVFHPVLIVFFDTVAGIFF